MGRERIADLCSAAFGVSGSLLYDSGAPQSVFLLYAGGKLWFVAELNHTLSLSLSVSLSLSLSLSLFGTTSKIRGGGMKEWMGNTKRTKGGNDQSGRRK